MIRKITTYIKSKLNVTPKDYDKTNSKLNDSLGFAIAFALFCLIATRLYTGVVLSGSMEPTLMTGGITASIKADASKLERGDIISFKTKYVNHSETYKNSRADLTKRVIGMPGDHIEINKDGVFINGKLLEENYLDSEGISSTFFDTFNIDYIVPEGSYFCLGDNRDNSNDGRFWSEPFVKSDWLVGKIKLIINPGGIKIF